MVRWYGEVMALLATLRATILYTAVIRPLRAAKRAMPRRLWAPLEAASLRVGAVGGLLARPFLLRDRSPRGRLRALLRFTELAEESLGIHGTNEILDDHTARRTIQRCPFADRIHDLPEFCTRIGACAGRGAFTTLVPGAEFAVLRTKSQGAPECEYEYRIPDSAATHSRGASGLTSS